MEAVFLKIVNMSITASWLVLAVILLRLLLKKAPKWLSGVLWVLVALRLILPFSIESVLSLIPSAKTLPDNFIYTAEPFINSGVPIINSAVNPMLSESLAPSPGASANPTQILSFIAAAIWLVGMVIMLVYMMMSYIALRARVRERVNIGENVYLCDKVSSPFILGIIRPKIYLPSNISEENKEYVLAHEKAHIGRGDHLWKPLGFILLAVYWFNPVLWIAYILLCRDIELACDEKVIKSLGEENKKFYSLALIDCSAPRRMIAACPLAFGEIGVKERVKRILNYKKPAFWIILVSLVAITIAAVCLLTNPLSTITIEEIEDPFSMKEMLDDISEIIYISGYTDISVTEKSEIEAIVDSLKNMRLRSTPISEDDARCSHLRETICLIGNGKSVNLIVPGYYLDDEQVYEQNVMRIITNVGVGYDYAVVDSDILNSILDRLVTQVVNANIENIRNNQFDIDIENGLYVINRDMSFWDDTRQEMIWAMIGNPQYMALKRVLSGISGYETDEYLGISPLFSIRVSVPGSDDVRINFYNIKNAYVPVNYSTFRTVDQLENIDDVYISNGSKYYGFDNATAKEALIELLKEIIEPNLSPLCNRTYGMDELVCMLPVLSYTPTPEGTPAYYISSYISGFSRKNPVKYNLCSFENANRKNNMESLGSLEEVDLSSKEYDYLFDNYTYIGDDNSYSVAQFRSPNNKAYATADRTHIISITPKNEVYLSKGSDRCVYWIMRLKDITPVGIKNYVDHIFYDINGDGIDESLTISGTSNYGKNTDAVFTVRRNGVLVHSAHILFDTEMYLEFVVEDGKLRVIGEEAADSRQQTYNGIRHIYDVTLEDISTELGRQDMRKVLVLVLSENGKVVLQSEFPVISAN